MLQLWLIRYKLLLSYQWGVHRISTVRNGRKTLSRLQSLFKLLADWFSNQNICANFFGQRGLIKPIFVVNSSIKKNKTCGFSHLFPYITLHLTNIIEQRRTSSHDISRICLLAWMDFCWNSFLFKIEIGNFSKIKMN